MSALAWIDFDQTDRDRARRIMDLFGVEDSRDELGLGSIRDGADLSGFARHALAQGVLVVFVADSVERGRLEREAAGLEKRIRHN